MSLENASLIYQLDANNPDGDTDTKAFGDDHIKMIKAVLKNNVPNWLGVVTATHTEVNFLVGVTSPVLHQAQKNVASGVPGLDANGQLPTSVMPSDPTFVTVRITSPTQIDLNSGGHGLTIGASTTYNLGLSMNIIQARLNGSPANLYLNYYGGEVDIGVNLGSNPVVLRGSQTYVAAATGISLITSNQADGGPADGAVQSNAIGWYSGNGRQQALAGFLTATNFGIRSYNKGGNMQFDVSNAGGGLETVFLARANGVTSLYSNGAEVGGTHPSGMYVKGDIAGGNGGTHRSFLAGYDAVGILRWDIGYGGADGSLYIEALNAGASRLILRGRDVSNAIEKVMGVFEADAGVALYYNGGAVFATTAAGTHTNGSINTTSQFLVNGVPILSTADFAQSLDTSGYQKLPGGLTVQWGQSTLIGHTGQVAVTFPLAFTTLYQITNSAETATGLAGAISLLSYNTIGAVFQNNMGGNAVIHYMAVGIV